MPQCKPRRIVLCSAPLPSELPERGRSSKGSALEMLGYDAEPGRLQAVLRLVHERAHAALRDIDGVEVVPLPLEASHLHHASLLTPSTHLHRLPGDAGRH